MRLAITASHCIYVHGDIMKVVWIILLLGFIASIDGANILAVMPFPSRSHGFIYDRLLAELAAKGHNITYLTASPSKPKQLGESVKVIEIPNFMGQFFESEEPSDAIDMLHMTAWDYLTFMPRVGLFTSDNVLKSEQVQQVIQSNEKFDLILGHDFVDESVIAGFAHKFKAPLVVVHPFLANTWPNYLVGNPAPAAFIPDPFLAFDTKMSFFERVENFLYTLTAELYHINVYLHRQDAIMKKHFGADYPPIHDILKNTSLVLVNHHHTLAYPRPYVPNMIEVGGMHIHDPKPLPDDLKKFMDASEMGVVLFSLGSNLQSADLPPETLKIILKAFGRLKQNVLWKFESDIGLTDLPKNVRVMKWIPQSDVLAHPSLKLFITHGGLLSTTESIHRGVPVVGIPFLGDQRMNMRQMENAGFGKILEFENISEESLYNAVTEVITNPKYGLKAREKSVLFKDNQMTPLDTAVWWIEYVLRHKGAKHLRSAAQDLKWFQLYLLDVYALALVIILVVAAVNIYIVKTVLRVVCGKKCKRSEKGGKTAEKKNK